MGKEQTLITLARDASAQFEEKKSVFIGHARPISSEEEALAFVQEKKTAFRDARHHVFAYLLRGGAVARCSDDGEPQGTAGMPVLDVLRKSGVDNAALVVTRYFGGTLLGAGGLLRAYTKAARMTIEEAHIVTYEPYSILRFSCSYPDYQKYLTDLPRMGARIDDTDFSVDVTLTCALPARLSEDLCHAVAERSAGKTVPVLLGSRMDFAQDI